MTVKNNSISITEAENEIIQAKMDLVETPEDWLNVLRWIWKEAGLNLEISWNPKLKSCGSRGNTYLGFSGSISGKNIDISGKKRSEVYSTDISVGGTTSFGDKKCIRLADTGSGGGGDNWSYDRYTINVEDFPLMKLKYSEEIDEVFVKSTREKFQNDYDETIDTLVKNFNESVNNFIKNDKKVREAAEMRDKILELVQQVNEYEKQQNSNARNEAIKKFKFDVPVSSNAFLDISKANHAHNIQCLSDGTKMGKKVTAKELDKAYNKFVSEHAERFL